MTALILSLLLCLPPEDLVRIEQLAHEYFGSSVSWKEEPLTGGIVSTVYKVECEGQEYVFRFAPKWQVSSHFWKECYITQLMYERGIAPKLIHVSQDLKGYILEYVPSESGGALRKKINQDPDDLTLQKLAEIVRGVHETVPLQPFRFILRMIDWIETQPFPHPQKLKEAGHWVKEVEKEFWNHVTPTMCHNDLHLHNVLLEEGTERAFLIDWTSSNMGDPYVDLVVASFGLKDTEKFLFYYLGREPTEQERAHFALSSAIFQMVIASNQMQLYGQSWEKDPSHLPLHEVSCQMEADLNSLEPQKVEIDSYEGSERTYWNCLVALKKFLTFVEEGQLSKWLSDLS